MSTDTPAETDDVRPVRCEYARECHQPVVGAVDTALGETASYQNACEDCIDYFLEQFGNSWDDVVSLPEEARTEVVVE